MTDAALILLNLAAGQSPGDPTSVFLQYGAIGAMVVILGLFAWSAYRRERDRADRLEQQLSDANQRIIDRFADVLKESRDALVDANDYLRYLSRRDRP